MKKEELYKLVIQEIDWLIYYGYSEDREKLTINSNIYDEIRSIGYTKRKIALYKRCASFILTSNENIIEGMNLNNLIICYENRDNINNKYTPLETYIIIFPDEKQNIIEKIKNK